MKIEVARMWVDALRSGEFKQGAERLKSVDGSGQARHCCLGVLCELAIRDGVKLSARERGGVVHFGYAMASGYLPDEVGQWAGIPERNPFLNLPDGTLRGVVRSTAARLNDKEGWSFAQIADAIEYTHLTDHKADGVGPS